jgi:hypothetical protein
VDWVPGSTLGWQGLSGPQCNDQSINQSSRGVREGLPACRARTDRIRERPEHGVKRLHAARLAWVDPAAAGPAKAVRLHRWCACFDHLSWISFFVGLAGRAEPLVVLFGLSTVIVCFGAAWQAAR